MFCAPKLLKVQRQESNSSLSGKFSDGSRTLWRLVPRPCAGGSPTRLVDQAFSCRLPCCCKDSDVGLHWISGDEGSKTPEPLPGRTTGISRQEWIAVQTSNRDCCCCFECVANNFNVEMHGWFLLNCPVQPVQLFRHEHVSLHLHRSARGDLSASLGGRLETTFFVVTGTAGGRRGDARGALDALFCMPLLSLIKSTAVSDTDLAATSLANTASCSTPCFPLVLKRSNSAANFSKFACNCIRSSECRFSCLPTVSSTDSGGTVASSPAQHSTASRAPRSPLANAGEVSSARRVFDVVAHIGGHGVPGVWGDLGEEAD